VQMKQFRFTAWDPGSQKVVRGVVNSESIGAVRSDLLARNLEPERIERLDPPRQWLGAINRVLEAGTRRRRRLAGADICEALAALNRVGMPLERGLGQLADSPLRSSAEVRLLTSLSEAIRGGQAFDQACSAHPEWFDPFDVAMLAAGQRAGDLATVLKALADHRKRQGAIAQQMVTALAYPAMVALAALAVFIFLTQTVMPRIASILAASQAELPALTKAVMLTGDWLLWLWPIAVIAPFIAASVLGRVIRRVSTRGRWGRLVHGNPYARLRARSRVAITSEALARLLRAGIPLTEALDVVAVSIRDRPLRRLLQDAARAVERGEDLSDVMSRSPLVEPEFAHMLRLGEGSGELADMLERIAVHYHESSSRAAERFAAVIGPAAVMLLSILVGILVLAVGQALSRITDLV
jgi:type II secretory pathway component PulF